ncbi:hypothetical protein [Sphaerothrix gracilis]|uniref:hypothetical protein n=1 Tax=Sphaerothrix gracilis TaxID=3151835 RepID=UPI0031FC72DC
MKKRLTGKRAAKGFWIDPLDFKRHPSKANDRCKWFDSELEFTVYLALRQTKKQVIIKPSVVVIPSSQKYQEKVWKCDYCLLAGKTIYVEAKGKWLLHDKAELELFRMKLQCIEYFRPDLFENLILVSDEVFKIDGNVSTIHYQQLRGSIDGIL